jgi:hypothetical protein
VDCLNTSASRALVFRIAMHSDRLIHAWPDPRTSSDRRELRDMATGKTPIHADEGAAHNPAAEQGLLTFCSASGLLGTSRRLPEAPGM